MKMLLENEIYRKSIETIFFQDLDFSLLKNKRVLITGATGLIGSVLVDMLRLADEKFALNLKFALVARNRKKFEEIFGREKNISFIEHDMTKSFEYDERIDFAIHLAANTHPVAYATQPVETITTNFLGTMSILDLCKKNPGSRFLNVSSVEIYGENKSEKLRLSETDFGYIDCNTTRAGYNESKRLSETLCQAYKSQFGIDFVTARICRCYGPTLKKDDSKALSQFIFHALNGEDIVLKSAGEQYFSYIDVFSAATAMLFIMLKGESGEAYNIADEKQDIKLKELAKVAAEIGKVKVIFDLPTETETKGFSKANVALLDSSKLKSLGWKCNTAIEEGIKLSLEILKS